MTNSAGIGSVNSSVVNQNSTKEASDKSKNYISDDNNVFDAGGKVLAGMDQALIGLMGSIGSSAMSVGDIARQNQEISNGTSAAADCISTAKQANQKITSALC